MGQKGDVDTDASTVDVAARSILDEAIETEVVEPELESEPGDVELHHSELAELIHAVSPLFNSYIQVYAQDVQNRMNAREKAHELSDLKVQLATARTEVEKEDIKAEVTTELARQWTYRVIATLGTVGMVAIIFIGAVYEQLTDAITGVLALGGMIGMFWGAKDMANRAEQQLKDKSHQ